LLETLQLLDVKFYNGNSFLADLNDEVERQITAKSEKGSSQKISFELYKQGNNIETIAQQRDMAVTTIEGHLAQFVESGDIDVFDFVTAQKVAKIEEIIEQLDSQKLTVLKEHLGNNFSFTEIKMALAHVNKK
jgi:uncharacterized protein YpbB